MKRTVSWILCCSTCLLASTAVSQQASDPAYPTTVTTTNQVTTSTRDADHSQRFTRSKDLVGAAVKDAQGQKLGDIDEIVFNTHTGEAFASIGVGSGRYAFVPLQTLNVAPPRGAFRNADVPMNTTKEALHSGPTLTKNEWNRLDDATFTHGVYSHYKVQPPVAVGGVSTETLGGATRGAGLGTNYVQPRR